MNPCEYSLNVEGWYDNIGKTIVFDYCLRTTLR